MTHSLPPLRALQMFETFGRLGSIQDTAQALNVTPGAVSQQLRLLEDHLGVPLMLRDGRRVVLTPVARTYHGLLVQGFGRLLVAHDYITEQRLKHELTVSGFPTLMQKWLNPHLPDFLAGAGEVTMRVIADHPEPDPVTMEHGFRLTYGEAVRGYAHHRALFTDRCFPVASPGFIARHPQAVTAEGLAGLPLIGIDWGASYTNQPDWRDWFGFSLGRPPTVLRIGAIHVMSSLALDSAAAGHGAVLAQESFVDDDLRRGTLVRLSPDSLPMPDPYAICWSATTLERPVARDFLRWVLRLAKARQAATI